MAKRVRMMLVTPPYHAGVVECAGIWMPLGGVYLAGHARAAGAEVDLYDAMGLFFDHDDIAKRVEDTRPDIVGVSVITGAEPDSREICRRVKEIDPNIMTVLGHVHPTFMWRELLANDRNVDVCVIGEGEETVADLVRAVAAGDDLGKVTGIAYRDRGFARRTAPRPFADDVDSFIPAWDVIDWEKYYYRPHPEGSFATVSSSRGCSQACSFCSQQKFWERTWRARDAEKFVDELIMLRDKYDVRTVMLSDETPTVNADRWRRILDLLIERRVGVEILMETRVNDILRDEAIMDRYLEAGISHIYVGVEATDQARLDMFKKNTSVEESRRAIEIINKAGIISETSFVLGAPDDTVESMRRTVELAQWYDPDMAFFLAIAPWPYADIYPDLEPYIENWDFRDYNLVEPVVKPTSMTLDQVRSELFLATGNFFHEKFTRLDSLPANKRQYMVDVLRLLIEHSYLGKEMAMMAGHADMPEAVKKMLAEVNITLPGPSSEKAS